MESSRNFVNQTNKSEELFKWIGLLQDSDKPGSGTPRVITLLASVLEKMILRNKEKKEEITVFHGTRVPTMSIHHYIERIHKYSGCSPSCFVMAFVYIQRYLQRMEGFTLLTSLNVHRLLITSVLVAAKFLDDECYNNAYYAKVGGVSKEEMNRLELTFLFDLDFRLSITRDAFKKYCLMLQREGSNGRQMVVPCLSRKVSTVVGELKSCVSEGTVCSCRAI
ncbi:PREDICTED: cyclin-P3-1 [Tarenaya hassleriana]|uniref:cyclin-P3-1 n=1 Tax=Tarenaya hassleriana TaxID=28532 RepID=UPI00053C6BBC|nr:PREDICTED: cyclin-P3-1 [Tarenaya hassleriana]